ncbi:MAG: winged helix-turn-helix domain-containing protein [Sideroxydans sp.]|nr:winged helix-turn-helix domain-containing protein [Sideroxydans sp.]
MQSKVSTNAIRSDGYWERYCSEKPIKVGPFSLSCVENSLIAYGVPISLRPMELRLLHFFMTHPNEVHPRKRLLKEIWGERVVVGMRTVDVHIRRLRATLEPLGLHMVVRTIHCRGYVFEQNYAN